MSSTLAQIRQERLEKIEKLKELGIETYPAKAEKEASNKEIIENFEKFDGKTLTLAGRLMSKREHGKLAFGHIMDQSGQIQLYIREDEISKTSKENQTIGFEHLNLIDVGDFVQATGTVTKTQRGEISLLVKELKLLTKSIRPLPEKWEGIKDKEVRYRRRYLDMTMNKGVRDVFERRSKFWGAVRDFLESKGFDEIYIPVLEHVTGGADANPFVTHMDALDSDFYLRISQELPLKRLLGGGFDKVFEIGPRFRNEGVSDEHLPEHIAMEYYWGYANFEEAMKLNVAMYRYIAEKVYGTQKFNIGGMEVDLSKEWEKISFPEIMKERFDIEVFDTPVEELTKIAAKNGVEVDENSNRSRLIDGLWKLIRKDIAGPAFLVDEPKFLSPLAKSKPENPKITERYHILIGGSELGNGYSELNDPVDQYNRFIEQQKLREAGDDEAQMMDIDFVEMLEYGMPPTTGFGLSERVFWYFENKTAREATPFPHMKNYMDELTKEIYPEYAELLKNDSSQKSKKGNSENTEGLPTREEAHKLLEEYVENDYQRLHAKMVASALEELSSSYNGDPDLWYITGLLHDLDFDKHPDEHPNKSVEWFRQWGYPEDLIHAVEAHAFMLTGVEPKTTLAKAIIAVDEFSGLLYAYSRMKGGKFDDMKVKSIKKKFKDKSFAAKIDRNDIQYGIDKLGIDFAELAETLTNTFNNMIEFGGSKDSSVRN